MKTKQNPFNTLNIVTTAMLCALGVILASALHALGGQKIAALFSLMHLPVFLAGMLCGQWLGLICGVLSPLMSFLSTGGARPPFPNQLIPMIFELAVYGFLTGLLKKVFLKNIKINVLSSILALVVSMVAGRIVAAFVSAIFLTATNELSYFVNLGVSMLGKFTSTWPGVIVQLTLIPAILFALQKSGVMLKYLPDSLASAPQQNDEDVGQPTEAQPSTADKPADKEQHNDKKDV